VGARVSADRTKVTVLLPTLTGERSLANIADNGLVAVTFSRVIDNRAVQVKGRCAPPRAATDEELALAHRYRDGFAVALDEVGMPPARSKRLVIEPAVALEVTIEHVFTQTPGPSAGQKLA
jgi:hypothetical protein